MTTVRRVDELLRARDSHLAALVRASQRHQTLEKQFNALVDAPIAEHVQVASADDGVLTLAADTPVWGHRIRYLAPAVLEQLRRSEPSLREVKIIVRPSRSEASAPPVRPRRARLSEASAALIGSIAATCDDPRLASVLRRLSKLSGRPATDDET